MNQCYSFSTSASTLAELQSAWRGCLCRGCSSKKNSRRVVRTELTSLDINETTIPLIKGLQRHPVLANMEVVAENKALRQRRVTTSPLGLMEAEEV